jgi:hypothetical protein
MDDVLLTLVLSLSVAVVIWLYMHKLQIEANNAALRARNAQLVQTNVALLADNGLLSKYRHIRDIEEEGHRIRYCIASQLNAANRESARIIDHAKALAREIAADAFEPRHRDRANDI